MDPSDSGPTPFSGPNSNNDGITSEKATRMGVALLESNQKVFYAGCIDRWYRARGCGKKQASKLLRQK